MKQIIQNQLCLTIFFYVIIIGLGTITLFFLLPKIKLANEINRAQLSKYQNLRIKDNKFIKSSQEASCGGNLFFRTGSLLTAIYADKNRFYASGLDDKLTVFDLIPPEKTATYSASTMTDFYSDNLDLYGADFLNDSIVNIRFEQGKAMMEKYFPKIGRPSALTRKPGSDFFVSGYSSGIITKIFGRDNFLFLSDLNNVVDMEMSDIDNILIARQGIKPTLFILNIIDKKQKIIENEADISSIAFDGTYYWVAYNYNGQSLVGNIVDGKLSNYMFIDCPFPIKITIWQDKLFYTSLLDNEGKIYWINKNLQKYGM